MHRLVRSSSDSTLGCIPTHAGYNSDLTRQKIRSLNAFYTPGYIESSLQVQSGLPRMGGRQVHPTRLSPRQKDVGEGARHTVHLMTATREPLTKRKTVTIEP